MAKAASKIADGIQVADGENDGPHDAPAVVGMKQLTPQDIQPMGNNWGSWGVTAQADHTIEDCLHPRYLYGKSQAMRPLDYIEIKHCHGQFVICLDVVRIDTDARGIVANIRHIFDYTREGTRTVQPDLSSSRIEHLGSREWCIVDGHHVVKDNFPTRVSAEAYLANLRRGRG